MRYSEGDWVLVPGDGGGWAPGLVARAAGDGICLGYFFARTDTDPVPKPEDFEALEPGKARLVAMFGDLGLVESDWPYGRLRSERMADAGVPSGSGASRCVTSDPDF